MIRLLEFGMKNKENRNPLIKIAAGICLYLTGKWADRTEKRLNRKWKRLPKWTPEREEELKTKILEAAERYGRADTKKDNAAQKHVAALKKSCRPAKKKGLFLRKRTKVRKIRKVSGPCSKKQPIRRKRGRK